MLRVRLFGGIEIEVAAVGTRRSGMTGPPYDRQFLREPVRRRDALAGNVES